MKVISTGQKRTSYILKIIVFLSAIIGTILRAYAGRNSFMGGSRVFMYFTIQSNIAIAIISAIGLYYLGTSRQIGKIWQIIKFVGTVFITLTGIGYVNGWQFAEGANYPYFFLNWGSEAGAFGFSRNLPFLGSAWWILALLIFLIIVGFVYLLIADSIKKATEK